MISEQQRGVAEANQEWHRTWRAEIHNEGSARIPVVVADHQDLPGKQVVIADVYAFDNEDNAAKRARLFAAAPRLFDLVLLLMETCEKELPEHLQALVKSEKEWINAIRR